MESERSTEPKTFAVLAPTTSIIKQ